MVPNPNDILADKYRIIRRIGEGGFAVVYLARQIAFGRNVALKLLHPEMAQDPKQAERFRREARNIGLLHHPNTVRILDYGVTRENWLFLVMEYLAGETLDKLISKQPLPLNRTLNILMQVINSVAEAHRYGMVHRDLKPENIMLLKNSRSKDIVKVLDFGVAKFFDGELKKLTEMGKVLGTPRYMAPEQFTKGLSTPASDVYTIGLLLWEMLSGKEAYEGLQLIDVARKKLRSPPLKLPPSYDQTALEALYYRMVKLSTEERFKDAGELAEAFTPIASAFCQDNQPEELEEPEPELAQTIPNTDPPVHPQTDQEEQPSNFSLETISDNNQDPDFDPTVEEDPKLISFLLGAQDFLQFDLLGRKQEAKALATRVEKAIDFNMAYLLILEGDAGAGKTHLASWIQHQVETRNQMRVLAHTFTNDPSQPFGPIRMVLGQVLGIGSEDRDDLEDQLASSLERLSCFSEDALSFLIDFLRPDKNSQYLPERPSDQEIEQLFSMIEYFFHAATIEIPLLVVLDEFHWIDPFSLHFISHLLSFSDKYHFPAIILCTMRSKEASKNLDLCHFLENSGFDRTRRFLLPSLSRDDLSSFYRDYMPLLDSDREGLFELSKGNPLYHFTLIRTFLHNKVLCRQEGIYYLDQEKLRQSELPDNLNRLVTQQLSQVVASSPKPGYLRDLLTYLALLGRIVPTDLIILLLRKSSREDMLSSVDPLIDLLMKEGLLRRVTQHNQDTLEFRSGLLRETLIESLADLTGISAIHNSIGEVLECYYSDRIEEVAEDLALHFTAAKDYSKSRYYHIAAAKVARKHGNHKLFLPHARWLIANNSPDTTSRSLGPLFLNAADSCRHLGNYTEADRYLNQCHQLSEMLQDVDLAASTIKGRGDIEEARGYNLKAIKYYRQAIALWKGTKFQNNAAIALVALAKVMVVIDQLDEAQSLLTVAENSFLPDEYKWLGLCSLRQGEIQMHWGHLNESIILFEKAMTLYQKAESTLGMGECYLFLAQSFFQTKDLDQVLHYLKKAEELFLSCGYRRGLATIKHYHAKIYGEQQRFDEAEKSFEDSLLLYRSLSDLRGIGTCNVERSKILLALGKEKEALELLQTSLKLGKQSENLLSVINCLIKLGNIKKETNRKGALIHYKEALEYTQKLSKTPAIVELMLKIGQIYLEESEHQSAEHYISEGFALAKAASIDLSQLQSLFTNLRDGAKRLQHKGLLEKIKDFESEVLVK